MAYTVIDYLVEQKKCIYDGDRLLRPDWTLAGWKEKDRWIPNVFPDEMVDYKLSVERGIPSLVCENDLTNIGYLAVGRSSLAGRRRF